MISETAYGFTTEVDMDFAAAVDKMKSLLKDHGFGVLTTIDVQASMKEKIDRDMEEYLILGVCNPQLAGRALDSEMEIGLMLPCNVIVYCNDRVTHVAVQRPSAMMGMLGNTELMCVGEEAEEKLKLVLTQMIS